VKCQVASRTNPSAYTNVFFEFLCVFFVFFVFLMFFLRFHVFFCRFMIFICFFYDFPKYVDSSNDLFKKSCFFMIIVSFCIKTMKI
jgi:hypothetical protein